MSEKQQDEKLLGCCEWLLTFGVLMALLEDAIDGEV